MTNSVGVANSLNEYLDQLYLGMLSLQPDPVIKDFAHRYLPFINSSKEETGGWTIYPQEFTSPPFITVNNSFVFSTHPYFQEKFNSGQLVITQKVYTGKEWKNDFTDIRLWLEFDSKEDAIHAYQKLIEKCSVFETIKRITSKRDYQKAEFTDILSNELFSSLQIILVKDLLLGKKWAVPTEDGFEIKMKTGYRILIEKENNLL